MELRWDRIIAFVLLVLSPVIINWLSEAVYVGPFSEIPVIGTLDYYPEAKALLLLGILLTTFVLIIKLLRS